MTLALLHLHLAQAGRSLQRAQNNNYSDQQKQIYQAKLTALYEALVQSVNSQSHLYEQFIFDAKRVLDFIYKSLEFLDSSTLNLIPYEIVECLKSALNDWISPTENYIIVTSLINRIDGFSFDPTLVQVDKIYDSFKQIYNVDFDSRLVQINIPRALSRDYLASVAHYHELGHFVDRRFSITASLTNYLINNWLTLSPTDSQNTQLPIFFPFLIDLRYSTEKKAELLYFHLGEYFCDLFASQYVGQALNSYLMYITESQSMYSGTHPASTLRFQVVADFVNGQSNVVIEYVNFALNQILHKQIEIRYEKMPANDLYNFLPLVIQNERQLHGLIPLAWDVWQGDWTPFQKNMDMVELPKPDRVYTVLNNLIEKSIGNYIVVSKWTSLPI